MSSIFSMFFGGKKSTTDDLIAVLSGYSTDEGKFSCLRMLLDNQKELDLCKILTLFKEDHIKVDVTDTIINQCSDNIEFEQLMGLIQFVRRADILCIIARNKPSLIKLIIGVAFKYLPAEDRLQCALVMIENYFGSIAGLTLYSLLVYLDNEDDRLKVFTEAIGKLELWPTVDITQLFDVYCGAVSEMLTERIICPPNYSSVSTSTCMSGDLNSLHCQFPKVSSQTKLLPLGPGNNNGGYELGKCSLAKGEPLKNRIKIGKAKIQPDPEQPSDSECVICMEGVKTHIVIPCGHLCLCESCSKKLNTGKCPVCNIAYNTIVKVYNV